MSEDDVCRLWCFIDRDSEEEQEEQFSVNANLNWDVEELRDAIQRRKLVLQDLDISDIVLLKVRPSTDQG